MVVTHVAARDPVRARSFAIEHGLQDLPDYERLIDHPQIDLIYVALPPVVHCEWTVRALEAGKAVLCEKPFAMNAAEAETMTNAARRASLPLIEAFHYRFHPIFRRAERLLAEQAIGRIGSARASFCTFIEQSEGEFRWNGPLGGGAMMDLGCYPIHALRTLIGSEPQIVDAAGRYEYDVEAELEAALLFGGEVHARVRCGMRNREREWDLEIVGERGRLAISNFLVPHYGCTLTLETDNGILCEVADETSTYAAQLAHVADVLLRGAVPLTGGRDAIYNMRAIEAIRDKAAVKRHLEPNEGEEDGKSDDC